MDLKAINLELIELLKNFEVHDLPNKPNIRGIFNSSDITIAISNGVRSSIKGFITLTIQISVASSERLVSTVDEENSLYELIELLLNNLEDKKLKNSGHLQIQSFENLIPESGKWRAILVFNLQTPIKSAKYQDECTKLFNDAMRLN